MKIFMYMKILLCENKFNIDTDDLTKKQIVEIEEELVKSNVSYKYCRGGII